MMVSKVALVLALATCVVSAHDPLTSGLKMFRKIYDHCEKSEEIVKCLKVQAVKIADRAIKTDNIPVFEGLAVVKRQDAEESRSLRNNYSEEQINKMNSEQLDSVLSEKMARFLDTHQMSMSMSGFTGRAFDDGEDSIGRMIEEGRGKLKKYIGPILTAIAIKGGFVAMAFQAIALIAGKALLIGKIALVLSAIIGLKKLVSGGEAHEKTTYEIVKHPQVSQSHTFSSSHYGGEYEPSGSGGHYRSFNAEEAQSRAYKAYVPRS